MAVKYGSIEYDISLITLFPAEIWITDNCLRHANYRRLIHAIYRPLVLINKSEGRLGSGKDLQGAAYTQLSIRTADLQAIDPVYIKAMLSRNSPRASDGIKITGAVIGAET